jgi:hypothetical protein
MHASTHCCFCGSTIVRADAADGRELVFRTTDGVVYLSRYHEACLTHRLDDGLAVVGNIKSGIEQSQRLRAAEDG